MNWYLLNCISSTNFEALTPYFKYTSRISLLDIPIFSTNKVSDCLSSDDKAIAFFGVEFFIGDLDLKRQISLPERFFIRNLTKDIHYKFLPTPISKELFTRVNGMVRNMARP